MKQQKDFVDSVPAYSATTPVPTRKFNDLPFALLYALSLCAFTVGCAFLIPNAFRAFSQEPSTPLLLLTFTLTLLFVCMLSGLFIAFALRFPLQTIYASFLCCLGGLLTFSLVAFVRGAFVGGAVALVASLFYAWYFWSIRRYIPFTAALLKYSKRVFDRRGGIWVLVAGGVVAFVAFSAIWALFILGAFSTFSSKTANWVFVGVFLFGAWSGELMTIGVHTVVASVFAEHFLLEKAGKPISRFPVASSCAKVAFSFGSIAFGSLLVGVVQTARMLIGRSNRGNRTNILALFTSCILGLLERIMDFINFYAFIQVALYGLPFLQAAKATFALMKERGALTLANHSIISEVLVLGCAFVCLGSALGTAIAMQGWAQIQPPLPLLFSAGVFGAGVYGMVVGVLQSAVATALVCWCIEPSCIESDGEELKGEIQKKLGVSNAEANV